MLLRVSRLQKALQISAQGGLGREIATHAMHATTGRGGRGAEKKLLIRCGIRVEAQGGAGKELPEVLHAAINVAADVVGVVALQISRGGDMTGEDAVPKAGGEAFNLGFYALGHVKG